MSRSSIFSFDTARRVLWRRLGLSLAATVVALVGLDLGLRAWGPFNLYGGYEVPAYWKKVVDLGAMARERGRVDALLLSSSIGRGVYMTDWRDATGGRLAFFNGALGGQRPAAARLMLERELFGRARPRMVIYCVSPRDVNSMGKPLEYWRRDGPLFNSPKGREFLASTPGEKALAWVESHSYIVEASRHARAWLQKGTGDEWAVDLPQADGCELPTLGKLRALGTEEKRKQDWEESPYRNFSMPAGGELDELVAMGKMCRERGVKLVVVSFPFPPAARALFSSYEKDMEAFRGGLGRLEREAGARVVDAQGALSLEDGDFYDYSHLNRWGSEKVTSYLYREVVAREWPEVAPALPAASSKAIYLSLAASRENRDFYVIRSREELPFAQLGGTLQVATRMPGARLPIGQELPPGKYHVDVYGVDERTSTTVPAPPHRLALDIEPVRSGTRPTRVEFDLERRLDFVRPTRVAVEVASTSTLVLEVRRLGGKECVLDSLFVAPTWGVAQAGRMDLGALPSTYGARYPQVRQGLVRRVRR